MGDRDCVDDLMRPTEPMAPVPESDVLLDAGAVERRAIVTPAIEELVVLDSGGMPPLTSSDAQVPVAREELLLRESSPGVQIRPVASFGDAIASTTTADNIEPAPTAVDDIATAPTRTRAPVQTTLGVAPLEPATVVRAPFVIDTPIPAPSRLPRAASPRASSPSVAHPGDASRASSPTLDPNVPLSTSDLPPGARPERTAMAALDPSSGMPREGIARKALAKLARRVRSVRWWMARRRRTDVIRRRP